MPTSPNCILKFKKQEVVKKKKLQAGPSSHVNPGFLQHPAAAAPSPSTERASHTSQNAAAPSSEPRAHLKNKAESAGQAH